MLTWLVRVVQRLARGTAGCVYAVVVTVLSIGHEVNAVFSWGSVPKFAICGKIKPSKISDAKQNYYHRVKNGIAPSGLCQGVDNSVP